MAIERHNWNCQIRVPDEDIKVEAAGNKHFVLLTVGHLSNGSLMTLECLDRSHCQVTENLLIHRMVLEVRLYLIFHRLLCLFFFRVHTIALRIATVPTVHLFLAEVPKVDFAIVDTGRQLVNIWQVLQALNEIVYEPWSMLGSIGDVLLALLFTSNFLLLETAWAPGLILIRHIIRITWLCLVVK